MKRIRDKRDHKAVLRKRIQKLAKRKAFDESAAYETMLDIYAESGDILPMPTLSDALSQRNISNDDKISNGKQSLLDYFNKYVQSAAEEHSIPLNLPKNCLSLIIPLDFYIPLPSPYNATTITMEDEHIASVKCISVISDIVKIDDSAVKISYLIATICDRKFSEGSDLSSKLLPDVYSMLVRECNNVIAGIQAIPTRHHHYMHSVTPLSSPATVKYFVFERTSKKIIKEGVAGVNGNVKSEIFHARPLDQNEREQFVNAHINKTFTDDKIFELVSRYNQATNIRCFGYDDEAIILADNFAELTLGYIFCQAKKTMNIPYDDAVAEYAEFGNIGELVTGLASLVDYSNTKFRRDVEFDKWYANCREVRNDLAHRFMTDKASMEESLDALHYSGNLIFKVCNLMQLKFPQSDHVEFFDKLELLKSTSYVVSTLHKGMHSK